LQAGASCTADVAFAPTAVNAQTGTFTLTSDQLAASVTEPLSGIGFDFHAENSGAASQTISSGQTASYMLAVSNSSPSSAAFTLACGALPAYAACVFNSSSTTITANSSGSMSLQITTSQAAALAPRALRPWLGWTPVLAVAFWPLVLRRRRQLLLTLAGLLAIVAMGLSACSSSGGGGGGSPPPPLAHTTPAGTYSIPVIVSAIGVQHTVTLTLVVD